MRLTYLRVSPQNIAKMAAPCADELQNLLACWRMNGVDAVACLSGVGALAACSATQARTSASKQGKASINFKLDRMFQARHD